MNRQLILLSLVFFTLSCAPKLKFNLPDRIEGVSEREKNEILQSLTVSNETLSSFKVLSSTKISSGEDRYSLRHAVIFNAPEFLRVETHSSAAAYALNILTVNGNQSRYRDVQTGEDRREHDNTKAIERVLLIRLGVSETAALLTGRIPKDDLESISEIYKAASGDYLLYTKNGQHTYLVDQGTLRVVSAKFAEEVDGDTALGISYSDYIETSGKSLPRHLELTVPVRKVKIELKLAWKGINEKIAAKFFE